MRVKQIEFILKRTLSMLLCFTGPNETDWYTCKNDSWTTKVTKNVYEADTAIDLTWRQMHLFLQDCDMFEAI